MTLEDGTYELVQEPEQGISEDLVNIAKDLTEAPNQSSQCMVVVVKCLKILATYRKYGTQ
jgi:hypothetical protein